MQRAGWFLTFTGSAATVLLTLLLAGPVFADTQEMIQQTEEALGQSNLMTLETARAAQVVAALLYSGLVIVAVGMFLAGRRLAKNRPDGLRLGVITTVILGVVLLPMAVVYLIGGVFFPIMLPLAALFAGPVVLMGWQGWLLAKAAEALPQRPPVERIQPAQFYVPIRPGELPPP